MSESLRHPRDIPPLWFLAAVGLMFVLHRWLPIATVVPREWAVSGYALMLLALPIAAASITRFRLARTAIKPFGDVRALVVGWPFTFTRNPMYLALVLITLGGAVRLGSLSTFAVAPLLWFALDRRFVRREERFLRGALGASYDDYCARVRRWL